MTKKERAYFVSLIESCNRNIVSASKKESGFSCMTNEQALGFAQGVSNAIECFAFYLGVEVASIPYTPVTRCDVYPTPDTSATIEVSKVRKELVFNINLWLKHEAEAKKEMASSRVCSPEYEVARDFSRRYGGMAQALFLAAPHLGIDLSSEFPEFACDYETSSAPAENGGSF